MDITIECFGAFRNFGDDISVTLSDHLTVADLRDALFDALKNKDKNFDNRDLISRSRFATDTEILNDATPLTQNMRLAIIPPVSGG